MLQNTCYYNSKLQSLNLFVEHDLMMMCTIPPLTWLTVGITPRLLKCSSVSGSTTSSQVSSPPSFMKATTSECFMDSMFTPLTWSTTREECSSPSTIDSVQIGKAASPLACLQWMPQNRCWTDGVCDNMMSSVSRCVHNIAWSCTVTERCVWWRGIYAYVSNLFQLFYISSTNHISRLLMTLN